MKLNKKFKVLSVGMLLVVTLSSAMGCSKGSSEAYNEIDSTKTVELIGETKNTLVIDVRDADAYAEGHLTNAINIPFDEFEEKIADLEGYKDQTIVLICNTGNKSGKAGKMLVDKGFTKVYNAEDGMDEFDYDTVKYTNVTGSEFEKLAAEKTDAVIIDLRDAKDFEKGSVKNSIHIPMDEFEVQAKEKLKDKNQEILLYCNTGTRTAEASQILEKNGYTNVVNSIDGVKEYKFNLQ
ncbi:MAG: rhodanese-like domain-containing protein [Clostridiales bacterium]|uniref:rhodanese-like domain-containing protein n=1 Tax=Terrisporobacter sp. TaxID=1965305 RepID=UPI002A3E0208|nr:rhodanese-like domain-containing protein [Terrisporobacter sp.]MCI6457698.1 rhodanese-like domain-containing protein [Clostridium sp.]MDD5878195.1 rhodanese-like domain-containing protein [Clostridiales bacterium]MCI7207761.1 rhodanese-like domain-containing protein [Clostridium sp.]MDD7754188.1 rhodanese-like domain-containing protein [Clostridiales bacterium]MDY4737118.1 rhodanese-like domain-containing protein [Terrisporobacter sp.]